MTEKNNVCLMKIINITPDSFSDGGEVSGQQAFQEKIQAVSNHCNIIDIGAESTAPFNHPISFEEEIKRFEHVGLFKTSFSTSLILSIDTYKPQVFKEVYYRLRHNGVTNEIWWNDVSGIVDDSVMSFFKITENTKYVLCHNLVDKRENTSHHMDFVQEEDILKSFDNFLETSMNRLKEYKHRLIIDPCFGFAKSREQNLVLLNEIHTFINRIDIQFLIGISRKSFLRDPIGAKLSDPGVLEKTESLHQSYIKTILKKIKNKNIIIRLHDLTVMKEIG